jgi:hypothetical protein
MRAARSGTLAAPPGLRCSRFAPLGAILSMLRLSEVGRRGAERVQVHDSQRLKGD